MISSQPEKDIGTILLQHPRWKIHRNCLMHQLNASMCELGEVCVWCVSEVESQAGE